MTGTVGMGGLELLDARGGYTPEEGAAVLGALDANARLVYAATGLTIDMAFPLAYGLLFANMLFRLFRAPLFVLPLAGANVLENLTVAALALGHAGPPSPVAWLAAGLTRVEHHHHDKSGEERWGAGRTGLLRLTEE